MGNRLSRGVLGRAAALTMCAGIGVCVVPAVSGAATITPASFTSCAGSLTHDPAAKKGHEPNLLDYSFTCNSGIISYSIVVGQRRDPQGSLQDFNAAPMVYETPGESSPSPTETVTCSGVLPSSSINCNTGTYLAEVTSGFYVDGSIDLTQPYCKHLPTTAKGATARPGTAAVPTAQVELIVTDWSGAQDGPFALRLPKACRLVPNRVPAPVVSTGTATHSTTKKTTTSSKSTKSSTKHSSRTAHTSRTGR